MGLSSSSSKTTVEPWKAAQAPILAANDAVAGAYNANAGKIQGYADSIGGLVPGLLDKFKAGNPAVNAGNSWIQQTLGQTGGNPHLQEMIDQTGNDTARSINANMGTRGLTGGSVQQHILAQELSKQGLGLRYNDYNNQQQLKAQAAGMAPGMAAADYLSISPLLGAAGAASGIPMDAAARYAGATGGLLGQYKSEKTTASPSLMSSLGQAASIASLFSDERLKTDVRKVGATDGGLPIYTYRYGGEGPFHMGTMAQDVAIAQPEALGPKVNGFMTVNYSLIS